MSDELRTYVDALDWSEDDDCRPLAVPPSNGVMHGPPDTDVGDLTVEFVRDEEHGSVITVSRWDLTARQRAILAAGGQVRLSVWQHPIPPLAVAVEPPFHCNERMFFDMEKRELRCRACNERLRMGTFTSNDTLEGDDGNEDGDDGNEDPRKRAERDVRRSFDAIPDDDQGDGG